MTLAPNGARVTFRFRPSITLVLRTPRPEPAVFLQARLPHAGAYYDADALDKPRGWLEALEKTPNAQGICYTTWQNLYALPADFGKLVSK